MKKLALVLVLATVLAIGAFAEHPGGWGVGGMYQGMSGWKTMGSIGHGASVSLKAPQLPVYWGINFDFTEGAFGVGVTGDYYLIDQTLVPDVNLGWYIGVGGYAMLTLGNSFNLGAGARIPIGIYIMPVNFLEIFIDVAPSLGLNFNPFDVPAGGLGFDAGLRFWF